MNKDNLNELQELKHQFNLLSEKLEKQAIVNETIIKDAMLKKISYIEKWYRMRFITFYLVVPIGAIMFTIQGIHWGFIALFIVLATIEYFLNNKSYRILNPKELPNLSVTEASENIIKHKHWRKLTNKIILPFMCPMLVWTIMIATNYTWNLPIIVVLCFIIVINGIWGWNITKANNKRLEEVLEHIRQIRG